MQEAPKPYQPLQGSPQTLGHTRWINWTSTHQLSTRRMKMLLLLEAVDNWCDIKLGLVALKGLRAKPFHLWLQQLCWHLFMKKTRRKKGYSRPHSGCWETSDCCGILLISSTKPVWLVDLRSVSVTPLLSYLPPFSSLYALWWMCWVIFGHKSGKKKNKGTGIYFTI